MQIECYPNRSLGWDKRIQDPCWPKCSSKRTYHLLERKLLEVESRALAHPVVQHSLQPWIWCPSPDPLQIQPGCCRGNSDWSPVVSAPKQGSQASWIWHESKRLPLKPEFRRGTQGVQIDPGHQDIPWNWNNPSDNCRIEACLYILRIPAREGVYTIYIYINILYIYIHIYWYI